VLGKNRDYLSLGSILRVVYPAFVSFFLRVVHPILSVFAPSVLSNVYCLRVVYPAFVSFLKDKRKKGRVHNTKTIHVREYRRRKNWQDRVHNTKDKRNKGRVHNTKTIHDVYPAFVSFFLRVVYPILPVFAPLVLSNVYCLRVVYPA
jgi:hypothetical protein